MMLDRSRRYRPIVLAFVLGILLVGAWLFNPLGRTIEFLVPNDFHGAFVVIEDPGGVDVSWSAGRARIQVPACRVVRLRSIDLFHEMTFREVRRQNSEEIPTEDYARSGEIALWSSGLGWTSKIDGGRPRFKFFVGTRREFEAFDFDAFPTPSCKENEMPTQDRE